MVGYQKLSKVYAAALHGGRRHVAVHVYVCMYVCVLWPCRCSEEHRVPDVSWRNIPDNLNSSSEAILTDMSWEKRSFWGRANVSGRLLIGSVFSLAPKVLKASR